MKGESRRKGVAGNLQGSGHWRQSTALILHCFSWRGLWSAVLISSSRRTLTTQKPLEMRHYAPLRFADGEVRLGDELSLHEQRLHLVLFTPKAGAKDLL